MINPVELLEDINLNPVFGGILGILAWVRHSLSLWLTARGPEEPAFNECIYIYVHIYVYIYTYIEQRFFLGARLRRDAIIESRPRRILPAGRRFAQGPHRQVYAVWARRSA